MKNRILVVFGILLAAIPFMYFIGLVDPVRESIGLKTYFTCVAALTLTLVVFRYIDIQTDADHLVSMRLDGLSDAQIRTIVGDERYLKMLRALK